MTRLLEVPVESGTVLIAVRTPGEAVTAATALDRVVDQVDQSLDDALRVARAVADSFAAAFETAPVESAVIEFGLSFTGKGKLYVVEAEIEATLKVTLTLDLSSRADGT
jgi:hypothetical protein